MAQFFERPANLLLQDAAQIPSVSWTELLLTMQMEGMVAMKMQ